MTDTYSQDLIFTVLPFGQSKVSTNGVDQYFLDFSVIISPRLKLTTTSGTTSTTLVHYPDWCSADPAGPNWATTIAALVPHLRLNVAGVGALPLTRLSPLPTHDHFKDVFPSTTPVIPYVYEGFAGRKIRSAPVGTIADHIAKLYGHFGLTTPGAFPTWESLVPAVQFGAIGFEQQPAPPTAVVGARDPGIPGNGLTRKNKLTSALEAKLTSAKAIPYDLSSITSSISPAIPGATTSLAFLQQQRFLQRPRASSALTTSPPPPAWDFHQMVAGVGSTPTLLRTLGFVVNFKAAVPKAVSDGWIAHPTTLAAHLATLVLTLPTPLPAFTFTIPTNSVLPSTNAVVGLGVFRPAPADPTNTDHVNRMLKLGVPSLYRVIRLDHENAAVKAMRFANTVTRSHHGGAKQTLTTPDRFALPALKTGGFAIARSGRAVQLHATLTHQTQALQDTYFGTGTKPPLTEDDLTRGYRFDVLLETNDARWRSLMWRQGPIQIGADTLNNVLEEDTVVPAPTTGSRNPADPQDLYLQETLTRWDGWSLAVPRVGQPIQGIGATNPTSGSSGFNVTTQWHVPGSFGTEGAETTTGNVTRLPRLRFGESYRLRARAVDLAGNSLSVASAPKSGPAISPSLKHLRFEPIPAPRLLLVDTPLAGASEEVIVVRSESATVNGGAPIDNASTTRLVTPAKTSVFMAEQHGAFDANTAQAAMQNTTARFADLAARDGYRLEVDPLVSLAHGGTHGTANPYVVPGGFLPISYLPEFIGREALVRNLPINAFKKTTAVLPFNTGGASWPQFEACRIVLRRGSTTWTTKAVADPNTSKNTTELDVRLAKGVMVTTLVNCGIAKTEAELMAVWEWIQQEAVATNKSTAAVWNAILAGEHWMFTPWRKVTLIHAVRTPLLVPVLFLAPTKTSIGQTYATFTGTAAKPLGGSVKMSRRSTARIDVDATWKMPIDTGTNADPVTPQSYSGHAFDLEVARSGSGSLPGPQGTLLKTTDAINFNQKHEFNDTKFRAVNYKATATSFYVEYFREKLISTILDANPVAQLKAAPTKPGVAFEGSTVKITLSWSESGVPRTRELVAAPLGTALNAPAPTPGDFVVTEDPTLASSPATATNGTYQLLTNADIVLPGVTTLGVTFSYVGPTIHTYSNPGADKTTSSSMLVLNSNRPKAPKVRYVVPIYQRSASATSITRTGGALRVYLERPWWSSGDKEELGVLCWHKGSSTAHLPSSSVAPYVTAWGYDPMFKSTTSIPGQPTPACFPLAVSRSSSGSLTLEETTSKVDVAGHKVAFDATRGLWYCDIQVTGPDGKELRSYSPFIRFAFARYQPHSIAGAHLSKVDTVDFAQLAPNRSVTVASAAADGSRKVTVTGRAPIATRATAKPSQMFAIVEQKDSRVTDDTLAWSRAQAGPSLPFFNPVFELTASTSDADHVTWTGRVRMPQANLRSFRVTFEEHERISGGTGHGRLVWTDHLPLFTLPS
ncbi:MAG: hypothetical protein QOG01_1226 [Pseudonocardiales bacterium]|nr:hypothetical protein [Pseudonocardiales bacterium]